ncbi:ATP-binding protein [Ferribacterium limneticum]|uniref:ATP-binding protein n=1 Tax=Ferribacterium limneticum TaxID=76259 RepID=UPI001CF8701C|nr:ATP-binding protein [Ferribacterium limneticum]UCV21115.1 ATP-binding protein [Ferribacterium limneticum]
MNAPLAQDWTIANQQLLVAEFARLKERLPRSTGNNAQNQNAETGAALADARQLLHTESAIDWLTAAFGLSGFERDLLLLCAGAEMDAELARACALAHGDTTRPWVTFSLALATLESPHWSALTPQRPLRRWRLIDIDNHAGLAASRLRIDERVLHFLVGINELDVRLAHLLRPALALPRQAGSHAATTQAALAALDTGREGPGQWPVIILEGDDPAAQEDIATRCADALGLSCLAIQAEDIPLAAEERAALITLWQREATLLGAALLVVIGDPVSPAGEAARALIERIGGLCLVACPSAPALLTQNLRFPVNKPAGADRRQLWIDTLGPAGAHRAGPELDRAASHFRLGSRAVQSIAKTLQTSLAIPSGNAGATAPGPLWNGCRQESRGGLDNLAQRLETTADWDSLVLPEAQLAVLRQIAAHLRQRFRVQEEWGFAAQGSRGLGLATLFAGESGTGKTLAAEVLAHSLNLDLYRIDLSAVVSKYIGETEKNLRRVFDAAEDCGAILLFDEADALFGKRTEVKDSHDRHANIEVSYLLQRMEAYHGLAVLTTNLKSSLDTAFLRRLRFVVQFPFPDQEQRIALWQRAFPAATPTRDLDLDKLSRLSMTGGSIRNIALNAAFLAADAGEPVGMSHLLTAAHAEASKRERPLADAETRGWA